MTENTIRRETLNLKGLCIASLISEIKMIKRVWPRVIMTKIISAFRELVKKRRGC
jgi:hypothetical protein